MNTNSAIRFLICVFAVILSTQPLSAQVSFSGTVRDKSGTAVGGAGVVLLNTNLSAVSDNSGAFTIAGTAVASSRKMETNNSRSRMQLSSGQIQFINAERVPVHLAVFAINGRKILGISDKSSTINLPAAGLSGYYVVTLHKGDFQASYPVSIINGKIINCGTVVIDHKSRVNTAAQAVSLAKSPATVSMLHYLEASKRGYLTGATAVNAVTASNIELILYKEDAFADGPAYRNPALPIEQRVDDLISRMSKDEIRDQLQTNTHAIAHLDVPKYNYWSEALHGLARAGEATVFPQVSGLASTWNPDLIHQMGIVISDEARAHFHICQYTSEDDVCCHLTMFSPNMDLCRDPRFGRAQETYGEDPYLASQMGVEYVKSIQGNHPRYLKLVATPKHFAVHSGHVGDRREFEAVFTERDLRQTYLPTFKACVQEADAESIMCCFYHAWGNHQCKSKKLLTDILRTEWGFDGYVVSDCVTEFDIEAGTDLVCYSGSHPSTTADDLLKTALKRILITRYRLGLFDPLEMCPYNHIPYQVNESEPYTALALKAAQESIVLLKNENNMLPLSKNLNKIAVIGPMANDRMILLGNYFGWSSNYEPILQGLKNKLPGATIEHEKGCGLIDTSTAGFAAAKTLAQNSDIAIVVSGLSSEAAKVVGDPVIEGEYDDRETLELPGVQEELLKEIHATGTPVVLVLLNGTAIAVNWAQENIPAIVEAWYPGEEGGNAVADVLFGDYNPGGKLPVTFYKSHTDLPDYGNYDMEAGNGRTYRYFAGEPLYPFGYGLSYTTFAYSNLRISPASPSPADTLTIAVDVENTGQRAGDEIVQLYISDRAATLSVPIRELEGFERIHCAPGEKRTVTFTVTPY
ncbi:MAG: hypothetical protein GF350_16380, partial [Chitinivibrionales bacterium]|nr:hypothetical protein [Chitinivibrionales bacterium]